MNSDSAHPYIVLLPGVHASGAFFDGKTVTVTGNDAIVDANTANITVLNSASVRLRDFRIGLMPSSAVNIGILGLPVTVIHCGGSNLTLDDMDINHSLSNSMDASACSVIIRNSIFRHGLISTSSGMLSIDRATFLGNAGIRFFNTDQTLLVLNSVFASQGQIALTINNSGDTTAPGTAFLLNNTFTNGTISCNGGIFAKSFESNIFSNVSGIEEKAGCGYSHNLIIPSITIGTDNITGDPLFLDAPNNDFHLRSGSPAIDAAPSPGPVQNGHDRDGRSRPQGAAPDMGAFEYSVTSAR